MFSFVFMTFETFPTFGSKHQHKLLFSCRSNVGISRTWLIIFVETFLKLSIDWNEWSFHFLCLGMFTFEMIHFIACNKVGVICLSIIHHPMHNIKIDDMVGDIMIIFCTQRLNRPGQLFKTESEKQQTCKP